MKRVCYELALHTLNVVCSRIRTDTVRSFGVGMSVAIFHIVTQTCVVDSFVGLCSQTYDAVVCGVPDLAALGFAGSNVFLGVLLAEGEVAAVCDYALRLHAGLYLCPDADNVSLVGFKSCIFRNSKYRLSGFLSGNCNSVVSVKVAAIERIEFVQRTHFSACCSLVAAVAVELYNACADNSAQLIA